MTNQAQDSADLFDTLRELIHQHGPVGANRVARRIARGLDALRSLGPTPAGS